MRVWLGLLFGVLLSSMSIAGDRAQKSKSDWVGKCAMPRVGAKYWMGGRETTQSLPLSLDVVIEDGEWLIISGGRVKKAELVVVEEAAAYYQSLLDVNPKDSWAMAMLGWYYVTEDEYDKAKPLLDKALQMDAKNVYAWLALGALYGYQEEFETAIKQCDEAIRVRPDCAHAFFCRGFYKSELGDHDGAMADYNAAMKICPEYSYAYMGRGALYDDTERWQEALADFDKSLSIDPYNDVTLSRRAQILATCPDPKFRDGKRAILDAERLCEISKHNDWKDLEILASAYAEAGRFTDAVKTQTKVVEMTESGRRFLMRLQLERYKQKKTYKFPPIEERQQ